jgi:hypothetical protein
MANKYDLKIIQKATGGAGAVINMLGAVPKGKTRFICFIKESMGIDTIEIGDGATAGVMTTVVDKTDFAAAGTLAFPDKVDVDNPLFSLAEGRFLNMKDGGAAGGNVTFVYFDE